MQLCDGTVGHTYQVRSIHLPEKTEKRLEALGMIPGTSVTILSKKGRGILITKFRGTRFAMGNNVSGNIEVGDSNEG